MKPVERPRSTRKAWDARGLSTRGGPFLYRDYRRRAPNTINSLLAMHAELYRRHPRSPRWLWPAYPALHGFDGMPKRVVQALRRDGNAAQREFGRTIFAQALDMARIWWRSNLMPADYYKALLARHRGGPEMYNYVNFNALEAIWIELQIDAFGVEAESRQDKAAFGAWRRATGFPGPKELVIEPAASTITPRDLSALGDRLIAKPRYRGGGRGVEAWTRDDKGCWRCGDRLLDTDELIHWFTRCAEREVAGLVVQERLSNHEAIAELCGEALSTCRVATMLNERDEPEVIEFFWRMATRSDAVVDNYHMGGICWMARDFDGGEIDHGIHHNTTVDQKPLTAHPITGKRMVGIRHPFWREVRDLALAGHRNMPDLIAIGWDIATTPTGAAMIEINLPAGIDTDSFLASNGIVDTRCGEILAWHALRWLDRQLPANSRRRVGSNYEPGSDWIERERAGKSPSAHADPHRPHAGRRSRIDRARH